MKLERVAILSLGLVAATMGTGFYLGYTTRPYFEEINQKTESKLTLTSKETPLPSKIEKVLCQDIIDRIISNQKLNLKTGEALVEQDISPENSTRFNSFITEANNFGQAFTNLMDICYNESALSAYSGITNCPQFKARYNLLNDPDIDAAKICNFGGQ